MQAGRGLAAARAEQRLSDPEVDKDWGGTVWVLQRPHTHKKDTQGGGGGLSKTNEAALCHMDVWAWRHLRWPDEGTTLHLSILPLHSVDGAPNRHAVSSVSWF